MEGAAQALGLGAGGELAGAGQPALDEGEAVLLGVVDEGERGGEAELQRVLELAAGDGGGGEDRVQAGDGAGARPVAGLEGERDVDVTAADDAGDLMAGAAALVDVAAQVEAGEEDASAGQGRGELAAGGVDGGLDEGDGAADLEILHVHADLDAQVIGAEDERGGALGAEQEARSGFTG